MATWLLRRMRTGILTKSLAVTLRLIALGPAVMELCGAIESTYRPNSWWTPSIRFWYFPLISGLFGFLCIVPYPRALFKRTAKPFFLGFILVVFAFRLRYQFFPFHYAAPELANHPGYQADFEAAKRQPNGLGFSSEHKED